MPFDPTTHDAIDALSIQQLLAAYSRSAWDTGAQVTVGASTSNVVVDVSAGDVFIEGSSYSIASQSLTLADGDPDHPRKDVIYVDSSGNLNKATGHPEPFEPVRDTDSDGTDDLAPEETYRPTPPDLAAILPQASVLAVALVPARASVSSDLSSNGIQDRRISLLEINGLTESTGDARYVNLSGDTMTGALEAPTYTEDGDRVATRTYMSSSGTSLLAKLVDDQNSTDDLEFYVGGSQPSGEAGKIKVWLDPV